MAILAKARSEIYHINPKFPPPKSHELFLLYFVVFLKILKELVFTVQRTQQILEHIGVFFSLLLAALLIVYFRFLL